MKKPWIAVISVLGAALIGAGVWFFVSQNQRRTQIEAAHDAVLSDYEQLLSRAEGCTVTVLEAGQKVGSYTLHELGVLKSTQSALDQIYTPLDRMSHEDFAALSLREKEAWSEEAHPQNVSIPVSTEGFDPAIVLTALDGTPRFPAQDAYADFQDGVFFVHDAVPGTLLREDVVSDALREAVSQLTVSSGAPASVSLDIADYDCYVSAAVTAENGDFDLEAMFRATLADMELELNFRGETLSLNSVTLKNFVSLADDGRVKVQTRTLRQQISAWAEVYDRTHTNYIFDSFVDGPVPIEFLFVDYTLDQDALLSQLTPLLETLESASVDAPFSCTTADGEPFAIENSYIEVDLTNQHMTYYQDGKLVVDTDVVTGMPGEHATPSGLFHSYYKCEDIWLSGEDYFVFVDYWVSVTPDTTIGLHDADWRTNFGGEVYLYGGSHGCVNTPKAAMKTIYDTINVDDNIPILVYHHQKPEKAAQ